MHHTYVTIRNPRYALNKANKKSMRSIRARCSESGKFVKVTKTQIYDYVASDSTLLLQSNHDKPIKIKWRIGPAYFTLNCGEHYYMYA